MKAHPGLVQVYNGAEMEVCLGAVEAHPGALESHFGAKEAHPWPWRLTLELCMLTLKGIHA
jgi:hypothetical protein